VSKPSLVIVVVEDDHHRMLAYRYLSERGLGEHQIRITRSPSGRGNAEGWVRTRFVIEVNVYRKRQTRTLTALIVVIDADTHTVQDRLQQLDQALKDSGKHPVNTRKEQIARLVPKRNVETWLLCLTGQAVDQGTDYKRTRRDWNKLISPAARTLAQWVRSNNELPNHCVDSLQHGVRELKRLHH